MRSILCVFLLFATGPSWVHGNEKIFTGRIAEPHSRPWQAWLRAGQRRVLCGAALIDRKFVLTAASCVQQSISAIFLGDHKRSEDEGTEQEFTPLAITTHPDFNETDGTFLNDIAVIELDARANVSGDAVAVIPLLPNDGLTDRIYEKHCRVCGWGYQVMGAGGPVSDQSDVLLQYTVDVTRRRDCINEGAPEDTAVCFEPFRDPTSVTCEGDVGGPLICKRKGVWQLTGVITGFESADGCATGLKAATKITGYLDWVNSIISA